jgi:hypothetical protein
LDGSQARKVIGSRWAYFVTLLLDKLHLASGDNLTFDFSTGQLLSCELQRLAGRVWCAAYDAEPCRVLCGETYSKEDWNEMMAFFRGEQN